MSLVERTVQLCRGLRERGLLVTTAHASDALQAMRLVGVQRRDRVHQALRCVLASRPEDFATFDELFCEMFAPPEPRAPEGPVTARLVQQPGVPSLRSWGGQGGDDAEEVPGASEHASLARKDFASFGSDELEEIERIAARIARKLSARPSRRWKAARSGARVDLRRTMRRAPANAGELLELRYRRRKPRKTRIVALCDVSGSMDLYSRLLLQFLYALQGAAGRVESFVFSTELRRVTDSLRGRDYKQALDELASEAHGWSGGTRIGACLESFNAEWGRMVDSRTVVVILSDGWDTGEPELLAGELAALKRRSRRLVWLNPLLGSPGYQPLTLGMQAALPHLSVFAPAHDLASLRALERHLS